MARKKTPQIPDKTAQRLSLRIYRADPKKRWALYDVDFGPLMCHLVDEPLYGFDGSMKVESERAHEWELFLAIALVGTAIFVRSALERLGVHFADWLVKQNKVLNCNTDAELRAPGMITLSVDPANLQKSRKAIGKFLKDAARNGLQVQVVLEPRPKTKR
jgi:hypothetical protein